jgi:hypothetical protein
VDIEFDEADATASAGINALELSLQRYAKQALIPIFYRTPKTRIGSRIAHEPLLLNRDLLHNHNS